MGFLSKLEKLSEKYVEGFFKNRFASNVQPAEIAKLLLREMRDCKTVSVAHVYVPNEYTVFLGPLDWKTIDSVHVSLSAELQSFLSQKAADKGYKMAGAPKVAFELDESLALGTVVLESGFSEALPGDTPAHDEEFPEVGPVPDEPGHIRPAPAGSAGNYPPPTVSGGTIIAGRESFYGSAGGPVSPDTLTRITTGVRKPRALLVQKMGERDGLAFPLGDQSVVIGRKRSNDISLDDTNMSRVHASVNLWERDYYITDLGSTNGTFVNGARISKKKLVPGDMITMGTTVFEYRVV